LAHKANKAVKIFAVTIFTSVKFLTLFLFSYFLVNLLVPDKVQAYTQQDCVNIAINCANRCINSINVKNPNVNNFDACADKCVNQIMAYCSNLNNAQPQKQQPQQNGQQPKIQQPQQKTQTLLENPPIPAEKGKPFSHDYSKELLDLLGPDSPGCPCSYTLDMMGGFPPMGLTMGTNGVLKGTPTGKDSKFRACVKDLRGNTFCKIINIDVKGEDESGSMVPNLTELAYMNLSQGKQYEFPSERAKITMPDSSVMYADINSMFIPVSDYNVKTDTGRFMYDYKPASGGGCGPIGESPTWACRQVDARDATLRVKGTQFAVDTDKYGTNIIVMEGILSVSDPKGKKTVEVTGGQYAYIAKNGLPSNPQSFDNSQVDFWWKEKSAEQEFQDAQNIFFIIIKISVVLFIFVLLILAIVKIIKKIKEKRLGKEKTNIAVAPAAEENNQKTLEVEKNNNGNKKSKGCLKGCLSVLIVMFMLIFFIMLAIFFM